MTASVIPFQPRRCIWTCDCGCTVHYLHADGHVECAGCETIARGDLSNWREQLPTEPVNPEPLPDNAYRVVELDGPASFLKRRLKQDDMADIGAILVFYRGGRMATFCTGDVKEHPEWLREKMAAVILQMGL